MRNLQKNFRYTYKATALTNVPEYPPEALCEKKGYTPSSEKQQVQIPLTSMFSGFTPAKHSSSLFALARSRYVLPPIEQLGIRVNSIFIS